VIGDARHSWWLAGCELMHHEVIAPSDAHLIDSKAIYLQVKPLKGNDVLPCTDT